MQTLADYLTTDPPDRDHLRALLVCPVHDTPTLTVVGSVSPMDCSPTHNFRDDSIKNPLCLDVGASLEPATVERRDRKSRRKASNNA